MWIDGHVSLLIVTNLISTPSQSQEALFLLEFSSLSFIHQILANPLIYNNIITFIKNNIYVVFNVNYQSTKPILTKLETTVLLQY
jgi:hypothetical protein